MENSHILFPKQLVFARGTIWIRCIGFLPCSDMVLISEILQNNGNNQTASQGAATSESNNLPIGRPSSGSGLEKDKGCSSASKDVHFTDQSFLVRSDSLRTAAATKASIEMLAQNRGNAMQRYKEKKKTRRFVSFLCHSFLFFLV